MIVMIMMLALCTVPLRRDMHLLPQLALPHLCLEQFVHIPLSHYLASDHPQLT